MVVDNWRIARYLDDIDAETSQSMAGLPEDIDKGRSNCKRSIRTCAEVSEGF